jgi:hypothetical protein
MIAALAVASLLAGGTAPCAPDPSAQPVTARVVERWRPGRIVETAVVACDRRSGRTTVLRRARLVSPLRGPERGRSLEAASAAGRRVAWVERRIRRRVMTGRVAVSIVRRDGASTVLRERRVGRTRQWAELDVALTTRGELAWLAGDRLVVERPGRRPRVVARGELYGLGVDDDRTLRWLDHVEMRFLDLRPWPAGTCPERSRHRRVAATDQLVVTEARYGTPEESARVVRACVRATGADRVIALGNDALGFGTSAIVAGISGPWVVVVSGRHSRYEGCVEARVEAIHAGTGAEGRAAVLPWCRSTPSVDDPAVVTDGGIPAWIVREPARSALLAAGPDGTAVELDAAGPAGLSALTADGPRVRWLHDGAPRAAELG